jgi:hypothetical protein
MLRPGNDRAAIAARLGGTLHGQCTDRTLEVERSDRDVSFFVSGDVGRAAQHLCRLGCEVAYR